MSACSTGCEPQSWRSWSSSAFSNHCLFVFKQRNREGKQLLWVLEPVQGGLERGRCCHHPAGTHPPLCPRSPPGPVCPSCTDRQLLSLVHGDTASSPVCPLAGEGTPAHLVPLHSPGCHVCPVCSSPTHAHLCQPQRLAPDGRSCTGHPKHPGDPGEGDRAPQTLPRPRGSP